MSKRIWSSLVLAAALAAPGCRMCCPSYDYCGPLDPAESNSECCGMTRMGSAFNGYMDGEVIVSEEVAPEAAPAVAPPAPVKKEPMLDGKVPNMTQARPIPVPQRDRSAPQTVQKSSLRRNS